MCPFTLCHPEHGKTNILLTLGKHIGAIVENTKTRQIRLKELGKGLVNQGYPQNLINETIKKPFEIPISELRQLKTKNEKDFLAFVSTFNLNKTNFFRKICTTFQYLQKADETKKFLANLHLLSVIFYNLI